MGGNYENANTELFPPFRTFKEEREVIWFLFLIIWRQIIPTETFYCMFQPGAIFFISAILTPEIEFIIETPTWSYLELWRAMTVQSIISQNPFLLPLLPSSPGHRKKRSIWENNISKLFWGQKSQFLHSILIKTTDIGCQRGTGCCTARLDTMLGLRDEPVCFLSGPCWKWPLLLRAFDIVNTNCLITWLFFEAVGETPVQQSSLRRSFQIVYRLRCVIKCT